ncbi:hypothetical protein EMCRGX_G027445 [Ephydatia muelleri]
MSRNVMTIEVEHCLVVDQLRGSRLHNGTSLLHRDPVQCGGLKRTRLKMLWAEWRPHHLVGICLSVLSGLTVCCEVRNQRTSSCYVFDHCVPNSPLKVILCSEGICTSSVLEDGHTLFSYNVGLNDVIQLFVPHNTTPPKYNKLSKAVGITRRRLALQRLQTTRLKQLLMACIRMKWNWMKMKRCWMKMKRCHG